MNNYVVYDTTTGVINRTGTCQDSTVQLQAGAGEGVLETVGLLTPPNAYEVNLGTLGIEETGYTPDAPPLPGPATMRAGKVLFSSDFSKTSDTTFATITNGSVAFSFDLEESAGPAATYAFRAVLFVECGAAGGNKHRLSGTVGVSELRYTSKMYLAGASATANVDAVQTALNGSFGQTGATALVVEIEGVIVVLTAGTLTFQFAQQASNGTPSTVKKDSFVILDRLQ